MTLLRDRIHKYLDDGRRGEIIRSGIHLAIVGPPNAGKSSLLNWLGAFPSFLHFHFTRRIADVCIVSSEGSGDRDRDPGNDPRRP